MRNHAMSRGRLLVVCVLGALASVVPTASADTTLPVWTCRASALYAEVPALLGTQRVEPVLANGFPVMQSPTTSPDTSQCANDDAGVQDVAVPAGELAPLINATAAFASTRISPEIAAARDQDVLAQGGVTPQPGGPPQALKIILGGITIEADVVTASATGDCTGTTPLLQGSSQVVNLKINGNSILNLPANGTPFSLPLLPLLRLTLNEQVTATTATGQELTQRALHLELLPGLDTGLPIPNSAPLVNVVVGEAKVDTHGAVCAPLVVPTCPAGTVAQNPNASPLVCILTVTQCAPGSAPGTTPNSCVLVCPAGSTADPGNGACVRTVEVAAPCPAGSIADPARGGACVVTVQAPPANCPSGTTRDPASNNCILIRDRPCPAGSTPDPTTRVCVATKVNNVGSGENGRVGSTTGPVATCGHLEMHFVRGFKNLGRSFTSRFGNRTVTRGQLVTCGSNPKPIIGARVDVVHVLPGNKRRRKTGLRSRAQGRLTLILPIDLRTRSIEYSYRPDLRSTRVTSRVTLHLTVKNRAGRTLR